MVILVLLVLQDSQDLLGMLVLKAMSDSQDLLVILVLKVTQDLRVLSGSDMLDLRVIWVIQDPKVHKEHLVALLLIIRLM